MINYTSKITKIYNIQIKLIVIFFSLFFNSKIHIQMLINLDNKMLINLDNKMLMMH